MEGRDLIVAARRGAGLTQSELAIQLGRRQPTISAWENGMQRPSFETVLEAVRACGQDVGVRLPKGDDSYNALIRGQLRLDVGERIRSLSTVDVDVPALLADLARAGAQFVLVGRVAGAAHGWPIMLGASEDRDLLVEIVPASIAVLEQAAAGRGYARVADGEWQVAPAARLSALERLPRTRGYRDLARGADVMDLAGAAVRVASLIDLIRIAEGDGFSSMRALIPALWRTLEMTRRRQDEQAHANAADTVAAAV